MDPYIGEIRLFAGTFAPYNWALCDGSRLPIRGNEALFALLGTTYGEAGASYFVLPDLRGRAPMHCGEGPGLSARAIGQAGGNVNVTLKQDEMPPHIHTAQCLAGPSNAWSPAGAVWSNSTGGRIPPAIYSSESDKYMSSEAIGETGGNASHSNMQPYLAINYIIAIKGDYPHQSE